MHICIVQNLFFVVFVRPPFTETKIIIIQSVSFIAHLKQTINLIDKHINKYINKCYKRHLFVSTALCSLLSLLFCLRVLILFVCVLFLYLFVCLPLMKSRSNSFNAKQNVKRTKMKLVFLPANFKGKVTSK